MSVSSLINRVADLFKHGKFAVLAAVLLGSIIFFPFPLAADTALLAPTTFSSGTTAEQQYKAATEYFAQLERDPIGKDRRNWLNGAINFQKIYSTQKKEPLGAASLYMMARLQRRMYDHFKITADLENAIERFLEVASLYPAHSHADASLYAAAENLLLLKGKEQQAIQLYQKIVNVYPKGAYYEKALAQVQEMKGNAAAPPVAKEISVQQPSAAQNLAQIAPIKFWASSNYTRIVIPVSTTVTYTSSMLEKENDRPRRLRIDFAKSSLSPKLESPVMLENGPIKQCKLEQLPNDTVGVLLDIASANDYKIFSLNEPFRVVIDILGGTPPTAPKNLETIRHESQPMQNAPAQDAQVALDEDMGSAIVNLDDQKKRAPEPDTARQSNKRDNLSLAQQLGLGFHKIVIDPGHGGKDPGAMAFNLKEKDIVLKVAKKAAKILKSTYRYEVALTRTTDVYLPLEERTAFANSQHGDLFISVHINASSDKNKGGIETYFLNLATNADAMRVAALENATSKHNISELQDILTNLMKKSKLDESSRLAEFVQTNLIAGVEQKYRIHDLGVKQAPFYVLIGAEMPAILSEIAFITNPTEARLLQDDYYLNKLAEQIAAGVAAYADHHHTAAIKF